MLRGGWGFSWGVCFKYFRTPVVCDAQSTLQNEYFAVVSTTTVMTSKMRRQLAFREVWENRSPTILIAGEKRRLHQFTKSKFSPLCPFLCIRTEHRRQQSWLTLCRTLEDRVWNLWPSLILLRRGQMSHRLASAQCPRELVPRLSGAELCTPGVHAWHCLVWSDHLKLHDWSGN